MTLKVPVTSVDHIQGDFNAPITLVEYGDYECPFCGMAYSVVKQVQQHFGKKLRFIFRNFPITQSHPYAENAAITAEFAAKYHKFWPMHDLLYENQENLEILDLLDFAQSLDLSIPDLKLALENKTFEEKIKEDFMGGIRSGVNGTPTFFINDVRYNGSFEYEDLIAAMME